VAGRLQIIAAALIAVCAISDAAAADAPFGLPGVPAASGVSLFAGSSDGAAEIGVEFDLSGAVRRALDGENGYGFAREPGATAGTTVRGVGGWTARLFVSSLGPRHSADDEQVRLRSSTAVNAQLMHRLTPTTRLTFDVFNVFDHRRDAVDAFAASRLGAPPGSMENFMFHPAEQRGFRLKLRTTF
jgi:hypothetical protein